MPGTSGWDFENTALSFVLISRRKDIHLAQKETNNFHLLRLLAACFVIFTHSFSLLGLPEHDLISRATNGVASFSRLGLWIFFVISGYLITASALRTDTTSCVPTVFSYGAKRILRIFPALIFVVSVSIFIVGPIFSTLSFSDYFQNGQTWDYLKSLSLYRIQYNLPGVFEHNVYPRAVNGSLWTLPYEFTLYIFLGILTFPFLRKKETFVKHSLLVLFCLALVFRTLEPNAFGEAAIPILLLNGWHFFNFALFFLAGSLLYLYRTEIQNLVVQRTKHIASLPHIAAMVLFVVWIISCWIGGAVFMNYIAIPFIVLFLAFLPCRLRPTVDISYGMYLFAFPVQQILVALLPGTLSPFRLSLLTILCTIPLAYASWRLVEAPALGLKRYL